MIAEATTSFLLIGYVVHMIRGGEQPERIHRHIDQLLIDGGPPAPS